MKKTCLGCKALREDYQRCEFDYKVEAIDYGLGVKVKPLEECPKPTTNKRYIECLADEAGRHQTMSQQFSTKFERLSNS